MLSPNMQMPIPIVGVTPAPDWAALIVSCYNILDAHDHTTGNGVPITPSAMNINADLPFGTNNLTALRSARFTSQSGVLTGAADLGCLFVVGADLYYNDGSGNHVRITQSGGVAGTPGNIANLTSPASAAYVSAQGKFVWQQAANTSADMDFGSAIMRNDTASSYALTLQPPTLTSNYTLTLPTIPGVKSIMALDASGVMSAPYTVDNATIIISSNVIEVGVIPVSNINLTSLEPAITSLPNLVGLTGSQLVTNINLPGTAVQESGKNLIVSSANATTSIALIRGAVNAGGTITAGEGFTVSHTSTGIYTINFTNPFASTNIVAVATVYDSFAFVVVNDPLTTSIQIITVNINNVAVDVPFHFIVTGPR